MFPWHQYILALLFILGGAKHFRKPKIYERIMPSYIPAHIFMLQDKKTSLKLPKWLLILHLPLQVGLIY